MSEQIHIQGRLVCIHWPTGSADATVSFDTTKLQQVKAEIEDLAGVIHLVDVSVRWDADYLVGKDVTANSTGDGITLVECCA